MKKYILNPETGEPISVELIFDYYEDPESQIVSTIKNCLGWEQVQAVSHEKYLRQVKSWTEANPKSRRKARHLELRFYSGFTSSKHWHPFEFGRTTMKTDKG